MAFDDLHIQYIIDGANTDGNNKKYEVITYTPKTKKVNVYNYKHTTIKYITTNDYYYCNTYSTWIKINKATYTTRTQIILYYLIFSYVRWLHHSNHTN